MLDGRKPVTDVEDIRLPIEPRTLLVELWLRRWHFLAVLVAALGVAAWFGILAGKRTYSATTLLRYTPIGERADATPFSLQTEVNQVKLVQNLSKVRERLGIAKPLESIGAAIDVSGGRDVALLSIRATWDDPVRAADLANTVRDVYMEAWLEGQLANLERMRSAARSEEAMLETQAERLGTLIDGLRQQAAQEQAQAGGAGNMAARFQRLREAIQEDRTRRANFAELARRSQELERARTMREQDLISPAEYERAVAAYRSQAAISVDTDRIKQWRAELDQMAEAMQAAPAELASPTMNLLNSTLYKSFDLDLQRVALSRKIEELTSATDRIREALHAGQRPEAGMTARPPVSANPETRQSVQQVLAAVLPAYGNGGVLLDVVADAEPPVFPEKSTRKKLALVAFIALFLAGAVAVSWRVVFSPAARSPAELTQRAGVPVLGVLPKVPREDLAPVLKPGTALVEARRLLADRVRTTFPAEGVRLLVTSPGPGDGRTLVTLHLGAALGLRGERVMMVDACVREPREPVGLESIISGDPSPMGLGEYLEGQDIQLLDLARCTTIGRVLLVPRGRAIESPEALGSHRMRTLLEDMSRSGSIVLVLGDPLLRRVDPELVARGCDAVLLAVRAGVTRVSDVRRAMKRLADAGTPAAGAVMVGVREHFLDID